MNPSTGVHMRTTIQVSELASLFELVPIDADQGGYREAVVEENGLGRKGAFMRGEIFKRLNAAYRLDAADPGFRTFRWLWSLNREARPMLALQRAWEDDLLLQAACRHTLQTSVGAYVDLLPVVRRLKPSIAESTLRNAASHLSGSLRQGGLLHGSPPKRRKPVVTPENLAYAVLAAYTRGIRGRALLAADEVSLLDRDVTELVELLRSAHARGWLDYRDAGNVTTLIPLEPLTHVRT